jgi:hypothetical protein
MKIFFLSCSIPRTYVISGSLPLVSQSLSGPLQTKFLDPCSQRGETELSGSCVVMGGAPDKSRRQLVAHCVPWAGQKGEAGEGQERGKQLYGVKGKAALSPEPR